MFNNNTFLTTKKKVLCDKVPRPGANSPLTRGDFYEKTVLTHVTPSRVTTGSVIDIPISHENLSLGVRSSHGYSPTRIRSNSSDSSIGVHESYTGETVIHEVQPRVTVSPFVDIPQVTPPRVIEGLEPIALDPSAIRGVKILCPFIEPSREVLEECFRSASRKDKVLLEIRELREQKSVNEIVLETSGGTSTREMTLLDHALDGFIEIVDSLS